MKDFYVAFLRFFTKFPRMTFEDAGTEVVPVAASEPM